MENAYKIVTPDFVHKNDPAFWFKQCGENAILFAFFGAGSVPNS